MATSLFEKIVTGILIVILAYRYRNKLKSKTCAADDTECADEYFSTDYTESRDKFLKYSANIKQANTYNIPIHTEGERTLYTDITILNENSKSDHVMLHISGTHGVEGFAGSGIQLALLDHIGNPQKNNKFGTLFLDETEDKPIIIFVHSLNPFGFDQIRRTNENNIDLNRNFKTDAQWHKFKRNGPNAFHYDDLNDLFNPFFRLEQYSNVIKIIPDTFRGYFVNIYHNFNYAFTWLKMPYFVYKFGIKQMKVAGSTGQMHNGKGLQFVGDGTLAESHKKLKEFLVQKFAEHSEWNGQISKVTMIDVHSGDSSYGIDKLLTDKHEYAMKLKQIFLDYDEKDLIQSLNVDSKDTQFLDGIYEFSNGYSFGYGDFMAGLVSDEGKMDVLAFGTEFGTNHMIEVTGVCQMMENAYWNEYKAYVSGRGERDEEVKKTMDMFVDRSKKWLKQVFYVQEPEWKKVVVKRGFRVFGGCLNR